MTRRLLSVWSPNWPITRRLRANRDVSPDEPFALAAQVGGARRLTAVGEAARAAGLTEGRTVADALALVPNLRTAEAEPEADLKALVALADWCERFSPAVAVDPPDGLLLDVTGAAHLWGDEAGLLDALLDRLARDGIPARGAAAGAAGCARGVARFGAPRTVVPAGAEAAAMAALPVEALGLAPEAAATLRRLGIKTVGAFDALPRAAAARRLGREALLRLDLALGRAEEALRFRRAPAPFFERLGFMEPATARPGLEQAAADVLAALCARLEREGAAARRFEVGFHRVDGACAPVRVGTALPSRDAARLTKLLIPKLDALDPGFGVEAVTAYARDPRPAESPSSKALPLAEGEEEGAAASDLPLLVDVLANRLGAGRVWRAAPRESWVPERAVTRLDPFEAPPVAGGWDPERPRPVRLFDRPEPIEAVAPVPDDPPVAFRWRGRLHRVRRAEGPERLAEEWWRRPLDQTSPERVRDYYQVEDAAGGRFWLFRAGLYRADRPARWFLHGLFG